MNEWTEEKLRKIGERRWGPSTPSHPVVRVLYSGHPVVIVAGGPTDYPQAQVWADTVDAARQMLAAAVCAPDLWALVEAASQVSDAAGMLVIPPSHQHLRWMAAISNLRAVLARLPEETL